MINLNDPASYGQIHPVPASPAPGPSPQQAALAGVLGAPAPSAPAPLPPPAAPAPATPDPFAAMGGGVQVGGGWVPQNHPLAAQGTPAPAAPGAPAPATPQTIQGAYQQALQKMLSGPSPQEMGRDVMSSPQVTGFNLGAQRAQERDRAMLAERAAAGGYSGSGGMESGILGNAQHYGEARARFAGEQAGQAEQGRRQELMQALALAQAMGDNDAARQIQLQLAQMSDRMQRDLSADQLGFNYTNLQQNANMQALLALLGGF